MTNLCMELLQYYYEPGTGRQFRSLVSIKRYLNGEEETLPRKKPRNCLVPYQNFGSFRRVVYDGKYYIEPVAGQKFRSVPEVQRYLQGEKCRSARRALVFSNHARAPRSSSTRKKNKSIKMLKDAIVDLTNPPEKINWVFSGDGRDSWSPLVEECMIPDYVKEQWSETFLLGMNGWKQRVPLLTMGGDNQEQTA
uniref:MBD domain-containing protein n=1 Tax=Opuntia streptacantha TaxID=393608 RepID=A0A7C9EHX5_OPUST